MTPRLYISEQAQLAQHSVPRNIELSAEQSHYLIQVLRLKTGASVQLFDGRGTRFETRLAVADKRAAQLEPAREVSRQTPGKLRITLIQGLTRNDKMDATIEKATELGVARVVVARCERSMVRINERRAGQKLSHWKKITEAACMQCGQDVLPEVLAANDLAAAIDLLTQHAHGALADARSSTSVSIALLHPTSPVSLPGWCRRQLDQEHGNGILNAALIVGPESGLSDAEVAMLVNRDATAVRLGPRVLRTETAGPAAIAVLQSIAGDLA